MASSDLATEVRRHHFYCILLVMGPEWVWEGHTQGPGPGAGGVLLGRHISRIPVQMGTLQRGALLKVRDWRGDKGGSSE